MSHIYIRDASFRCKYAGYRNGDGQNGLIADGNKSSDLGQSSINGEHQGETEAVAARIDPITEHTNHENEVCNNNNSINRNDNLNTENSEKEVCLSPISVASVASVADIHYKNEKEVPPSSKSVASVAYNNPRYLVRGVTIKIR